MIKLRLYAYLDDDEGDYDEYFINFNIIIMFASCAETVVDKSVTKFLPCFILMQLPIN